MKSLIRQSVETLSPYLPGEQPSDGSVVKLNTNENPYPPSPGVGKALAALDADSLRLYPDPVCSKLRARIAAIHRCDPRQVFVGNGSDEVLALCTRAFVEDDGSIGWFSPSYSLYPVLAKIRGVRGKAIELPSDFGWPVPRAASMADCRSSLFFIANPNAPTAILYPKAKVAQFCRKFPGVVVLDEAYVDFARASCMELALRFDNVIVARTLSKGYSLAGLRLGYAVGPKRLISALFKIKDSYNVDRISQAVALAALSDLPHMRRNTRRIKAARERLSRALARLGHVVYPSQANFLWVRPRSIGAERLFEELRRKDVLIRYFPGKRTGEFVRITVGTDEQVDKLIGAMRETGGC